MSQETFARVEKKYVISREQYEWIRQFLAEYTVEDEYGQSTIRNVYYDTPGEEMIRHSIQKPEFKEKVRVRGYGKIGRNDDVFVELKRKYQGIVYKRRVSMPLSEAEKFLARRRSWNSAEGKDVCCQGEKESQSEMVRKVFLPQKERPNQEEGVFEDILQKYTKTARLIQVKTINMGSMYELRYEIALAKDALVKEMIDDIRTRNANLTVSCSRVLTSREEL